MPAAIIVIDSGFSLQSLAGARNVLAYCDVFTGRTLFGDTPLSAAELSFLGGDDRLNHGSIVLESTVEMAAESPLILVRAFSPGGGLIRTRWHNGHRVARGWTEGYLWAVEHLQKLGLPSVANCSFGGFTHAMDGTGWESFQLGQVTGKGKPGHIVVAAAGPGDGRNMHASCRVSPGHSCSMGVEQADDTNYNFWVGSGAPADWVLEVRAGETLMYRFAGDQVPLNFWNNRQQLTFTVRADGPVSLVVSRSEARATEVSRFDCWINSDKARFVDHVDPTYIAEPAIFPQVLSAGLQSGSYSPEQNLPGGKPDVLLSGHGPISFRLPEVTARVAQLLAADPSLDVDAVRTKVAKLL